MQRFALGAKLCRLASIGTVLELAAEALGRSGKKLLIKLDGYRCIAVKRGREVTLFSRHKKVLNRRFLGVVEAFASLESDFVLDGELVALDSQGRPSFQLLQNSRSQSLPIYYYS